MGRQSNPKIIEMAMQLIKENKPYLEINKQIKNKFGTGISPNTVTNLKRSLTLSEPQSESNKKQENSLKSLPKIRFSEIVYEEKFNTLNYDNKKFSLKATIDTEQDISSAFFLCKIKIDRAFKIIQYYDKLVQDQTKLEKALGNPNLAIDVKNQYIVNLDQIKKQIALMIQKRKEIDNFMSVNFLNLDENEEKT